MILLLGGSGYVGSAYREYFDAKGTPYAAPRRSDSDYTQPAVLRALIQKHQPHFLINAAGYTGKPNVDACELHKADCLFGNAIFPEYVRMICEETHLPWGHVSSGCIYSGTRADGNGFTEEDAPNFSFRSPPCSFYAGTKALGEEILAGANCYIWRLRIPFGPQDHARNYLSKLMRYERLHDVRNSLSRLDHFVEATLALWEKRAPWGIYNVTNPGSVTTREVAEMLQESGLHPGDFKFFQNEAEFLATAAKTPRSNCVLDTTKLQRAGVQLPSVQEALADAIARWRWESQEERRLAQGPVASPSGVK